MAKSPVWRLHVPADAGHLSHVRAQLRRWLGLHGIVGNRVHDVLIVVTEAVSNSIEHAYRGLAVIGEVTVTAHIATGRVGSSVVTTVSDQGRWRHHEPPARPVRGLALARLASDRLWITHGTPTTLTATFTLTHTGPAQQQVQFDGHHPNGNGSHPNFRPE